MCFAFSRLFPWKAFNVQDRYRLVNTHRDGYYERPKPAFVFIIVFYLVVQYIILLMLTYSAISMIMLLKE